MSIKCVIFSKRSFQNSRNTENIKVNYFLYLARQLFHFQAMSAQKVTNAAKTAISKSKIYKKVMMVPPKHFDVIHKGLNAHMKYEITRCHLNFEVSKGRITFSLKKGLVNSRFIRRLEFLNRTKIIMISNLQVIRACGQSKGDETVGIFEDNLQQSRS